jgi:hypothetical protein
MTLPSVEVEATELVAALTLAVASEEEVAPKTSKPPLKVTVKGRTWNDQVKDESGKLLGLPMHEALTRRHDVTHFGVCELESIWERFSRRSDTSKRSETKPCSWKRCIPRSRLQTRCVPILFRGDRVFD